MKVLLIIACICCFATEALAGAKGQDWNDNTGIVTPDKATGSYRYSNYAISYAGDIMVCPSWKGFTAKGDESCVNPKGVNSWQLLKDSVPAGKQYVGFKSVSGAYGHLSYEVYWK